MAAAADLLRPSLREAFDPSEPRGADGKWGGGGSSGSAGSKVEGPVNQAAVSLPSAGGAGKSGSVSAGDRAKVAALGHGSGVGGTARLSTGHVVTHVPGRHGTGSLKLKSRKGATVKMAHHTASRKSLLNAHRNIIGAIHMVGPGGNHL